MSISPPPAVPVHVRPTLPVHVLSQLGQDRDVLSTWWPTCVLGVLALALGITAARRWSRRRGRRRAVTGLVAAITCVVVVALAVAAGVNTATGYLPSTAAAQVWLTGRLPARQGQVRGVTITAPPTSGLTASTTYVYTPPGYRAGSAERYPVVYLLHGTPGTSVDWFAAGGIAHTLDVLVGDHLMPPVIAVAPDLNAPSTDDTECLDSTRPGGPQVEAYLTQVVHWVDAHDDTQATPRARVIAGMSMGGYCALDQGLRHQRLYGAIIGLEPYGEPGSGGRAALTTAAEYDAVTPIDYLPTMAFTGEEPTFLDMAGAGSSPQSSHDAQLVAAQLAARGQPVYLRREVGLRHSWTMAAQGIPYGLVWVSRQLHLRDRRLPLTAPPPSSLEQRGAPPRTVGVSSLRSLTAAPAPHPRAAPSPPARRPRPRG